MKSQLLSTGAIACSTMMIYGWVQAAASQSNLPDCQDNPVVQGVKDASEQCAQPEPGIANSVPERMVSTEWGDQHADQLPPEMETVYGKLLAQAQASANREEFTQALRGISGIPANSRHAELAHRLESDWSQALLQRATEHYQQADLTKALSALAAIPHTSPVHEQTVSLKQRWIQQDRVLKRALTAKADRNWQGVINAIDTLESTPLYHSQRVQALLQQAITQRYEPARNLMRVAIADIPAMSSTAMAEPELITWGS